MRRERPDDANTDGFDSFLDVVCNLVGILVILIMVLGVSTKKAQITSDTQQAVNQLPPTSEMSPIEPPVDMVADRTPKVVAMPDVETPARDATSLREDAWRLDAERKKIQDETNIQRAYRDKVQLLVAFAERDLAEQRASLDQTQQAVLERTREKDALSAELASLQQSLAARKPDESQPTVIEHHPTPLAKTVFGIEWHYQLKGGRLAYVPLNEFVRMFEDEARRKVWKLESSEAIEEQLGPMQGYTMRYVLGRRTQLVRTSQGMVQREGVGLVVFKLIPTQAELGVSLDEALRDGSEFVTRLKESPADDTTITVWTYPDSFVEYHQLKKFVWERGYTIAARPLPEGEFIGGSPDGTKSATQ